MPNLPSLLASLRLAFQRHYADRLTGLYLFGSYARGDADGESDVDILVVLSDFQRYGVEVDATSGLVADLSLQHGVCINTVFVRERTWRTGDSGFLRNARAEAVAA